MIGTSVAHYKIVSKLGEGGMGEVYRATDTKLNRDVALKILPEQFASDSQRMGRFQREAEVLASLDHPNIGAIYGIEEAGPTKALVLQLIEGPTLGDRIAEGAFPIDEALPIALQISEALEAAHEKGVVHRDLKPANIKITPGGQVKILDFGLAKAMEAEPASSPDLTQSPTLTMSATREGIILGTAAYMSPEQARGRPADRRSDIWSFGCVLYEMLSGEAAFRGETVSDTLAAILKETPDWAKLPDSAAGSVRRLLRRCLARDPQQRLRDAGDVSLELTETLSGAGIEDQPEAPQGGPGVMGAASRRPLTIPIAAAVIITSALTWMAVSWFGATDSVATGGVSRRELPLAEGERLTLHVSRPAVSPDGSTIAYTVRKGATSRIYLRRLDEFEARPVTESADGQLPFFSPDGSWLGFTVLGGDMYKVPVAGGERSLLARGPWWGAFVSWGAGDRLVADSRANVEGLALVDPASREVTQMTARDLAAGEVSHLFPEVLPDGSVLFAVRYDDDRSVIERYFPERDVRESLGVEGSGPISYLHSGHLVFQRAGASVVAQFDLASGALGSPVAIFPDADPLHVDVSPGGTAVYVHFPVGGGSSLVRVGRDGTAVNLVEQKAYYRWPRLSPDGRRLALGKGEGKDSERIWTIDLVSSRQMLLQDSGSRMNSEPVWTPDGRRIAYSSSRQTADVYWQDAGGGVSELLSEEAIDQWPTSFSPDGAQLMFYGGAVSEDQDLWVVPVEGSAPATAVVQEPGSQRGGRFHPGGNWIAYASMDTGRWEVIVRRYPELEPRLTASSDGGIDPIWSPDGSELFYLKGDRVMAVAFDPGAADPLGVETELFEFAFEFDPSGDQSWDVFPDGRHFVMLQPDSNNPSRLRVVTGFLEEVDRLPGVQRRQ